ncbi:MAG TPA: hypothetical protein VEG32_01725, partial [Clostridia bacterium]|nr:hypothetical protein [Clostridia bacterium]
YGFNHLESERSFDYASKLDPKLAIAHWGVALALGSNINDPITKDREQRAAAAIRRALRLKQYASPAERAYIDALARRYIGRGDRAAKDRAYANAMSVVARRYPNDPDAASLYADSLMNLMPWDYYTADGKPKPEIRKAIVALEGVMKRWPRHPGAHHLYIHAVEASNTPERGERSADVLGDLVPAAGHLVHMPGHIYMRVGRYHDAVLANERAIAADEDYITQCRAQGVYPLAYYPHNIHFMTFAAMMDGRRELSITSAEKVRSKLPGDMTDVPPWASPFTAVTVFAKARFGAWDEILQEPKPDATLPAAVAMWHYGRGLAYVRRGDMKLAQQERAALASFERDKKFAEVDFGLNKAVKVVEVAGKVLDGEMAAAGKQPEQAITHLRQAVKMQDALRYNEPEDWYMPVRQALGAVLLDAGRAAEAEKVYREDLARNRENGWSLYGLMKSLEAQGKREEAAQVQARFEKAWKRSDVKLTASRF